MKQTYIMIIIFLSSFKCFAPPIEVDLDLKEKERQYQINSFDTKEFTKENLINYIKLHDSINYEIIVKQCILETGWFKSRLARQYNNMFGMMHSKRKNSIDSGIAYTYSVIYGEKTITYHPSKYNHWTDSVKDYFLWRDYKLKQKNLHINNYYVFLNQVGYAVESNYCKILKTIKI